MSCQENMGRERFFGLDLSIHSAYTLRSQTEMTCESFVLPR